ncbi:hypothetical protein J3E68DRAFT_291722 [Trichoderma sp. SZMC 28012]
MCSSGDGLHKHVPVLGAWYYLDCPLAGHSLIACQMPPSTRKLAGRRNGQQKKKTRKHDEREQGCAKGEGEGESCRPGKEISTLPSPNFQGWSATSGTRTGYLFLLLQRSCLLLSAVVPLVPVLAHAPVPCTCTMARPVLFSPCPYPGLPPMAGRLKDFRTSRVASRRRLFPAPDALRSPRSCPSRSHAHARSSFKFAARQSGEL